MNRNTPRVSIVISTYNRAATLRRALASLRYLRYPNFEVIVVNGPSTDATEEVLAEFDDAVVLSTSEANLSLSRNIGIANASGEIVAFMDDDAVPEPDWIDELLEGFADPDTAAVGGFIRNHTGVEFQARAVVCDYFGEGEAYSSIDAAYYVCETQPGKFLSLTGTNSAIRMRDIEQVGGFDETFEYFLDETDINLRLAEAGRRLRIVPSAEIHHKYAASHLRTERNVPKRMFPICRSVAYFRCRHGQRLHGWNGVMLSLKSYEINELSYKAGNLAAGDIDHPTYERLVQEIRAGIRDGIARSANPGVEPWAKTAQRLRRPVTARPFRPTLPSNQRLRLCMLSQDEGLAMQGGIGRWTRLVAGGLAARGHEVTVIGRHDHAVQTVDFTSEGYWSHRLPEGAPHANPEAGTLGLPESVAKYARRVRAEFDRVRGRRNFNVVSAPIWDVEGASFLADRQLAATLPICVSLHTTVALALDYKPEWRANETYFRNHVQRMMIAESVALRQARLLIANSDAIVKDVQERYQLEFDRSRIIKVPHGVEDVAEALRQRRSPETSDTTRILFVGRLERRKGADLLADVAAELCARHPNIVFDFVGAGSEKDVVGKVQAVQDRYKGRVRHHGYVTPAQLNEFYASADVFVAPSLYESFGLIFAEAMRYSLPCVGFKAGGVPEVVTNNETGLLVNPNDEGALLAALDALCTDPQLARALGAAGRRRYEAEFTVPVMVQRLEEAYMFAQSLVDMRVPPKHGFAA